MPKATFFRLDEEKQSKIIDAAIQEFTDVPIEEASIANMIKLANIPRGSFYQYFSSKDDVFYYVCELLRKDPEAYFIESFKASNGELFQTFNTFFDYFSEIVLVGPHAKLLKNIFLHLDYKRSRRVMVEPNNQHESKSGRPPHFHHNSKRFSFDYLYDNYNKETVRIKNKDEFIIFMHLAMNMISSSINEAYRMELMTESIDLYKIKEQFHMKLNWLKYGMSAEKEETN